MCHDNWAVVLCAKYYHDSIIKKNKIYAKSIFIRVKFRAHIPFGKWVVHDKGLYIYISFIRSRVTYNNGTVWKRWQTNTKCAGENNRLSEKRESKNQYKNLKVTPRHCHVHNDISKHLRYGSNHGAAATPQPSLDGGFDSKKSGNKTAAPPWPHPHHTSKSAYVTKKFLSFTFSEFTYAIQPVMDTKQFMICVILALISASRAGSPLKLWSMDYDQWDQRSTRQGIIT